MIYVGLVLLVIFRAVLIMRRAPGAGAGVGLSALLSRRNLDPFNASRGGL